MEIEDYDYEYLREKTHIEMEMRAQMEAEWQEAEYYKEKLPAKVTLLIEAHSETTTDS